MTATAAFPATVLDAGLDAISRGFALFPVNGATTRPATPQGCRDATLDPDTARAWWGPRGRYRSCGIGVATGAEVGLWVLDIDAGHDGFRGIEDVERRLGFRLPDTATVASPAGGLHLHWRHPGATVRIRNSTAVLASGLDVRGDSACITIPPTRRPDGRCYSWLRSWDELVAAPPDLLELVR